MKFSNVGKQEDLEFSFLDIQKLAFKKISEISLKASESDNINHLEAAGIIKALIDILKITIHKDGTDLYFQPFQPNQIDQENGNPNMPF